jgi:hypothetical protein
MTDQDMAEEKILLDIRKKNKRIDKVLNEKSIGTLLILGGIAYLLLLIENIILASFYGYSIFTNYISELGDSRIIPFPFLNDGITIFCGIIMFFNHFYYVHKLKIQYHLSKSSKIFMRLGFLCGIIGAVGYLFLGIFNLDRAGPNILYHAISMGFAFTGFLVSIAFYSLAFFLIHNSNLKKLGLYGLIFPFICFIVYSPTNNPFAEWIVLFSIISFFLVFTYYIRRY